MKYNATDMYELYKEECLRLGEIAVDFKKYKEVLYDHNTTMIDVLLEGGIYSFGFGVGYFGIKFCEKEFKLDENNEVIGLSCDFGATNKLRAETGDNTLIVYHTDPFFYKWEYAGCSIHKQSTWDIKPTIGPLGIGRKIAKYVKENPLAKENYMKYQRKNK